MIGHKEWQPGKQDPRGFTMDSMRARIAKRLGHKPDDGGDAPTPKPKPEFEPSPGQPFFPSSRNSPIITAMGKRLVAEGCGRYEEDPGPDWTSRDRESCTAWQRKLGFSGKDADGIPGRVSWERLRVPAA